jgi:hypothetical protein
VELKFKKSFIRDIDDIGSKEPTRAIEELIRKIKEAKSIYQIQRAKALRQSKYEYKIELRVQSKIYWILCDIRGNIVLFLRIKSESWCKKNL